MFSQGIDLYDLVAQSLPTHAIVLLDSDFIVQTWNEGAERLTGISAEQATGKPLTRVTMPEGASSRGAALQTAREKGRFEHEGWWSRPDGTGWWVDEVIAPVLDEGELIGYVDIARHRVNALAID